MRTPEGFRKSARRGGSYYTEEGRVWIKKIDNDWHLIVKEDYWETVGLFPTMTEAVSHYRNEVAL